MNQKLNVNLLAIDTATEACSVALSWQGKIYSHFERCPREHTQKILPMVEQVLMQAEVKLSQLDAIAFGQGPGSFTGVRIGVAAAQGLAFGANLPMIGVSTLAAMAQQAIDSAGANTVVAAIDARMGEIYHAIFANHHGQAVMTHTEQVISPEAVESMAAMPGVAVGTGWETYGDILCEKYPLVSQTDIALPRAYDMLKLAKQFYANGQTTTAASAQPVYLRDKVTWKKLPGRE
ncbi:tRNA (adenosine(37)-N6)-threonylcarbamoyltransferase complex dimerization subunit type 1 TsaB [Celerinatantimonas diazotrophica]|uniref:tRNA threonylcarbamoyladenosine biosynthesis protein TsaB n=1 Tax=Celerinatantimonas diazotrophica TaxID=412034 RepID=A0A4R1JAT2_9GAMM|nr:tRNA (adenosine(37)-N6)-threonylcarbamoyltransferase complex dimerization subunit type 1 TsaB [Celerinatantimonas diazotrophica]TCK47614.1 tRNA threonylcarbamoyladenosine biosynthesis protein TsaB [Celerinatantimonas diazotrophica]CAG9296763.1 tRNA threonylcarbamoyladenosine biosynthesis protein TsaB [Celerinatantimonas diazotrophica]